MDREDNGVCDGTEPDSLNIQGAPVSAVGMGRTLTLVDCWIAGRNSNYICFRDVYGAMANRHDTLLQAAHERAGMVRSASTWMQRTGLEWLFGLLSEPGRLWRRYLVLAPAFLVLAAAQMLDIKRDPAGQ